MCENDDEARSKIAELRVRVEVSSDQGRDGCCRERATENGVPGRGRGPDSPSRDRGAAEEQQEEAAAAVVLSQVQLSCSRQRAAAHTEQVN